MLVKVGSKFITVDKSILGNAKASTARFNLLLTRILCQDILHPAVDGLIIAQAAEVYEAGEMVYGFVIV
jgi:hypothetical protein